MKSPTPTFPKGFTRETSRGCGLIRGKHGNIVGFSKGQGCHVQFLAAVLLLRITGRYTPSLVLVQKKLLQY